MDFTNKSTKQIKIEIENIKLEEYPKYGEILLSDSRKSVQSIGNKLIKEYDNHIKEKKRLKLLNNYENQLFEKGIKLIAGIDEVGRGPLAGPVVAAAVILPFGTEIIGINDSKKVPKKLREKIYEEIYEKAEYVGIGVINNKIIDKVNILNATKKAMIQAVEKIDCDIEHLLIDAVKLEELDTPQTSIIKGDEKSISIAAASIIAKVTRDRMMDEYHEHYPCYDFDNNKGYGTEKHYSGIKEFGITDIHRKSFLKNIR